MKLIILSISLVTLLLFSACGGSSGEAETDADLSVSLQPRPIPQEYQGLTMEQLKAKTTEVLYYDLNVSTDYYKGNLVWFEGKVKEVFEGKTTGTYQITIDTKHLTEVAGNKVDKWRDPIFLLYSLERGPELHENDMVQFASTVLGTYTTKEAAIRHPGSVPPTIRSKPMVNAIKVELANESN